MKRAAGFTLLEVLVALAILSIGVTATMRALGMVSQSANDLRARQLATWVAQNRLAEMRALGRFPELGSGRGEAMQAGRRFTYSEDVQATPNPLFRRVAVTVYAEDGGTALVHLIGIAATPLR